jgi:hypothetical protein
MTTLRPRVTVAVLVFLAAGLSACAAGPTAPLDLDSRDKVSADVDTTKRTPTVPWTSVQSTTPTVPWTSVQSTTPTVPWN